MLILLEAVQTTGTIFDRKTSMLHLTLKHINATLKETHITATGKDELTIMALKSIIAGVYMTSQHILYLLSPARSMAFFS